jgi:hypothetical protein
VVGRRGENFGVEKRWEKYIYAGREDGIFVHPKNNRNKLIHNWCIGGCWFTPAHCCACAYPYGAIIKKTAPKPLHPIKGVLRVDNSIQKNQIPGSAI